MDLREMLQEALRLQAQPYDRTLGRSDNLIKEAGPETLAQLIPEDYKARGGTGEGCRVGGTAGLRRTRER